MAFLIGALIGYFLLSRLIWLAARQWPNCISKALVLNIAAAAIIIPLDLLTREPANPGDYVFIYLLCAIIVSIGDVIWVSVTKVKGATGVNRTALDL